MFKSQPNKLQKKAKSLPSIESDSKKVFESARRFSRTNHNQNSPINCPEIKPYHHISIQKTESNQYLQISTNRNLINPSSLKIQSEFSNLHYEANETQREAQEQREYIEIQSILTNVDLNCAHTAKKHSFANPPSLIIDFIFKANKQRILKFKILFLKFLLPHILATLSSFLFIYLHIFINKICWVSEKCNCENNYLVKAYTIARSILTYWNLIFLIGYYSLFFIKEIKLLTHLKFFILFSFYGTLFGVYLYSDGSDDNMASLFSYGVGFFLESVSYFTIFYKLKFNYHAFKEKTFYQTLLLIILFSHLIGKRYVFAFVKTSLQNQFFDLGKNLGQIVISFYSFFYKMIFKYLILKFSLRILKENGDYNAIIFFMRLIVCFIICINTSNIYEMSLTDWGGWILIATYCVFLFEFYARINPYARIYYWIKAKFYHSVTKRYKTDLDYERILSIKKVLSGYLLDFQFIFIPRIIMLYYFNHLIDFHSGDFSSDCSLSLSKKFPKNFEMLILIIVLNICMPILFFLWMHRKKEILFEFRFENYNILQRTYIIFLFHTYFEFIFQDFLTS